MRPTDLGLPLVALVTLHATRATPSSCPSQDLTLLSPSTIHFTTDYMSRSNIQHQHLSIPKGILNLELFHPEQLRDLDDDAIASALQKTQQFVRPDTFRFVLEVALERQGCLEFLLSSLSQDKFNFVLRWVNQIFPRDLGSYSATSVCARLISTISLSLLFFHYPNENDKPQELYASHQYVVHSNAVLQALVDVPQSSFLEVEEVSSKASQKARKYAKKRNRQAHKTVDMTSFQALHLEAPASLDEANEMALEILTMQKEVLMSYLDIFRRESLTDAFKRNYIPSTVVEAIANDRGALLAISSEQVTETPEEVPSAFPQVQPMKAALYFDSAEGFGHWRVLISGRADRDLRQAKKRDKNLFHITLKKIKELSHGHFSDDNQKRLIGANIPVPIFEAKMTRDSRLVYQVDCVQDFESQADCQVIRVFGIYTHAQLDRRLWDLVGYQLSRTGKEYQRRCTFRANPVHKGDKVIPPASFPVAPPDLKMIPDELPAVSDKLLEELHEILVLEKFVAFSQALLTSILADQEVVHVFQVSPHEQEIIEHTHSCFVQGRSGTGKTTTMLFKMLGIENSGHQNRDLRPERPRQLFVTQSRMLADKVEEYFIKLLQSLVLASQTTSGIADLLERQKNREEAGLVDQDEALNWREDLPRKFSELEGSHFPMFITFDKLSSMIEADTGHPLGTATIESVAAGDQVVSSEYMLQRRQSFISFDVFRSEYWGHFPQSLTKGLDVSLVFSEFMGVIKGSETTLNSENHFLDCDTYLNLSTRTQAMFASKRKEIYALFEAYLKMKRDRREYDAADRTHAILRNIAQDGLKGQMIDFLYVDEVQDNLLIDAKLLRAICRNPDGQFWAGDTAQTISVGSSFRFDDLKAFLHRNEERLKQQSAGLIVPRPPKSFQLVTNFRSHGGIVRCAHSVIVLITRFWPYAIDILPEERGVVDGIKPVFFSGWDQDNVRYESFLFGTAGHHIEFGANQCILVRSDAAREKLRGQVGDIGLIMTLYESKGLEFNDVLLYNFFEDSSVDVAQWRVVLNAIDRAQRDKIPAPTFDENRHAGVCAELKFLYVAITRARKNLWIVDRSVTGEPIRIYWSSGNLVQTFTPSGESLPQLAVSSSPEEWAKMARTLFSHKRYFQSMHSYERAGMPREKAIAYAYHLREQARKIPIRSRPGDSERRQAYAEVAEAFLTSAQEATIIRERNEYYRIAAESYLVLDDHARAAQTFEKASMFTEAAQHYRHAGMFDEMVPVILNHRHSMDSSVAAKLTDVARYFYFQRGQRGDLKKASRLFSDAEEELEFVRDCDLDIAEVQILVERGEFLKAAELHIRENRMLDAVEVLLKDKASKKASLRASQSLLRALWSVLSFGILPVDLDNESRANLKRTIQLVEQFDRNVLDERTWREFQMFSAIYKGNLAQLLTLGRDLRDHNKPAALLCFDHCFRDIDRQTAITGSLDEILNRTRGLCDYAELAHEIFFVPETWASPGIRKLFSFTVDSGGHICLPRHTFLHSAFKSSPNRRRQVSNDDASVDVRRFCELYETTLRERLRERLKLYADSSLSVRIFDPCDTTVSKRRCERTGCQRQHELNHAWFEKRLYFHMCQISILHTLQFFSKPSEQRNNMRRYWFERLYDIINPAHLAFGSSTNINLHANRQTSRTFQHLLKTFWIWPKLGNLDPTHQWFLSTFLSLVDLGSFIDSEALVEHVNRTCLNQQPLPPCFMRETNDRYVIAEVVWFLRGRGAESIHVGTTFIQHIISKKIPIEITVLCRFLELVVGSFIMASAYKRARSFHGVTLPRSWILENIQKLYRVQYKDVRLNAAWGMMNLFQDLLECVYSGDDAGHLLHQHKSLHSFPHLVRNLALARLCRTICLLGYNISSRPLKDRAFESITSLRRKDPTRVFSALCSHYVEAKEWRSLAYAVTSSISPTPLDEMITLVDEHKNPLHTLRDARPVKFKDVDDIRRQLTAAAGPASTLNPSAVPFVPTRAPLLEANDARPAVPGSTDKANGGNAIQVAAKEEGNRPSVAGTTGDGNAAQLAGGGAGPSVEGTGTIDDVNEDNAAGLAAEDEDEESPEGADLSAIIESMGADFRKIPESVLVEQHSAARTLQAHYRRLLKNRTNRIANPGLGLAKIRKDQFEGFARAAQSIEWPNKSLYRPIFLGAVPHLLTCLDYTLSILKDEKTRVKRSRSSEGHQDIEVLMERKTDLNNKAKRIEALQSSVGAASNFHKERNLKQLEVHVGKVCAILEEISQVKEELAFDMAMACAWRRYVNEPRKPKAAKPVLNVDDLDDMSML